MVGFVRKGRKTRLRISETNFFDFGYRIRFSKNVIAVYQLLTACERYLFAAPARKIYECLSHTPTVDGLVRSMKFGISLRRKGGGGERNVLL